MKYLKKVFLTGLLMCCMFFLFACKPVTVSAQSLESAVRYTPNGKWVSDTKGKKFKTTKGKYLKSVWIKVSGKVYRIGADGYARTGWINYKGKIYYAKKSGIVVHSAWVKISGKTYYFQSNGTMAKNTWVKYYKKGYRYLGSDGVMRVSRWIGNHYVGSDGVSKSDCIVDGYWMDGNGRKTSKVSSIKASYIFVGDSRTVGMSRAVSSSRVLFLAKGGSGYSWLTESAEAQLKLCLAANPTATVILAHGVNDLQNINSYIACYRKLIALYPKAKFYVMSVNPIEFNLMKTKSKTAYKLGITDARIQAFNKRLRAAFPGRYIDTYSYMKTNGFSTVDGLHYPEKVYKDIYNYVMKKINS